MVAPEICNALEPLTDSNRRPLLTMEVLYELS